MSSSKRRKTEDENKGGEKKSKKDETKDGLGASASISDSKNGAKGVTIGVTKEWEFGYGKNKWKPYDPVQNKTLSVAFHSGEDTVDITTPKATFSVIFERMVQRNKKTGWEVSVRCKQDASPTDQKYVWQCQDKNNSWKTYSEGVCRLLDAVVVHELKTVSFHEEKNHFTINMMKKEQVDNSSKAKSAVRHVLKDVADKEAQAQPVSSKAPKSRGKKATSSKASAPVKEEKESLKSVVFTGKSPVDDTCPIKDKVQVLCEGNLVWDAMLNQTDVKNNNNKYYLMQLLQDVTTNAYHVWFRWGRVGYPGQNSLTSYGGDLAGAKSVFKKKFGEKTKNNWDDKDDFRKVPGKYDLIIVDYNAEEKDETDAPAPKKPKVESKLDKRLQTLIELICNVKNMEDAVKEMKYDTNKAPLGKLTKEQIKAGFSALKIIDQCISKSDFGSKLVEACNAFYTRIPHCFGMRQPPLIRTKEDVKLKVELLETLGDIEIAMKVLKEELDENPIDSHYKALKCDLLALDTSNPEFTMIEKYIENTHAKTHNYYTITVEDVFAIDHPQSSNFVDYGNNKLLWHGSRLSNWIGILNQGLRIAPPEAPVTGYMFGKGVYFADMCSKSANYCYTNKRQNTGLLLLSEVSLGKTNDLLAADYNASKLPSGCHTAKGLGSVGPDPKDDYHMSNGTVVPLGKGVDTGVKNPNGYTLNYNEYIVYDTKQIKMKYLIKCKFNYI